MTLDLAARFADLALGHVRREYPNKLDHALAGPADAATPRALHPIFYGSFDWHSCVHGHWLLARLLRRFPDMRRCADVRALFDEQFTPETVAGECAYFAAPTARGFKRPYGWAWLLKLAAELTQSGEERWSRALVPLADLLARRFCEFLPIAAYPVRSGAHFNTAFGLRLAADYRGGEGSRTGGSSPRCGAPLVRRGRRLPGLGRAERRRLPVARLDRGRVHAASLA